jgi:hypothetical protein
LGQSSCAGIIGLYFICTNIFFFLNSYPFTKLIGDHQQLNIVYDAALLADAEKSADPTIQAQITATKLSHTAISDILKVNNNTSSKKPPQAIKRRASKPSVRF